MNDIFQNLLDGPEFAEEYFVAEVQTQLSEMMDELGVTRAELARKLGVSRARVTQIFSDEAKNLTLRLLFRAYAALGEEPLVVRKSSYVAMNDAASGSVKRRQTPFPIELPEDLVADLLNAAFGKESRTPEQKSRRADPQDDWAAQGSNVLQFRGSANA